jgi:hypothetical protein
MQKNEEDSLYTKVKEKVLKGEKHLPYRQYIEERTLYYIENIATIEELDKIERSLNARLSTYEFKPTTRTYTDRS